jgi:hypothetical protein
MEQTQAGREETFANFQLAFSQLHQPFGFQDNFPFEHLQWRQWKGNCLELRAAICIPNLV